MVSNIDSLVLNSIETEWKSVPQIAQELDVNVMRVHKCIKYYEKINSVLCMYGEKTSKETRGKIPKVFMKRSDKNGKSAI